MYNICFKEYKKLVQGICMHCPALNISHYQYTPCSIHCVPLYPMHCATRVLCIMYCVQRANFTMCNPPCTPCTAHCALCTMHCTPFALCSVYCVQQSAPCIFHPTPCTVHCALCTVCTVPFCIVCTRVYFALCTSKPALCTVHCTLPIVCTE